MIVVPSRVLRVLIAAAIALAASFLLVGIASAQTADSTAPPIDCPDFFPSDTNCLAPAAEPRPAFCPPGHTHLGGEDGSGGGCALLTETVDGEGGACTGDFFVPRLAPDACQRFAESPNPATSNQFTCPTNFGATLVGDQVICYQSADGDCEGCVVAPGTLPPIEDEPSYPSQPIDPEPEYPAAPIDCPDGFECVPPNIASSASIYSCPAGATQTGSGPAIVCTVAGETVAPNIQQVAPTVTCPAGTTSNGAALLEKVCLRRLAVGAAGTAICPAGQTSVGDGATKICVPSATASSPAATSNVVATSATGPVVVATQSTAPVVVSAASYGFGDSLPTTATHTVALAHTGASSNPIVMIALALVAAGAILLGSRRRLSLSGR